MFVASYLMQLEALPFKMTSLLSRCCDERVLVCRSHLLQNCKIQHCGRIKQQMPAAGTSHCGSYKSPGPEEHAVINSSLTRDGEFVFFPPSVPCLSRSEPECLYFSPPSGGLSSNQSDAVRHTHSYSELCVWGGGGDWQVVIISHWGELDYCGIIWGFSD